MISVTISSAAAESAAQWDDLVRRAAPNVFMDPAALDAARATRFADIRILSAWEPQESARRLVGLWALQVRKVAPFWPTLLEALPYNYAFLSSPVVDPLCIEAVVPAFVAALRACRSLPSVVSLKSMDIEAPSFAVLQRALAAQGGAETTLASEARPIATREAGVKRSGSTRKKLRQDWNRLSALGAVDVLNAYDADGVGEAFETFLRLEQASWKGEQGTALLCDVADAKFTRLLVANLAVQRRASVALLRIDGRPIAAQVLMYCGTTAYTWKTAFDAAYSRFSPGALLVDQVTEQLFASGQVDSMDSCAAESSFMAQLWSGRRAMADVLIDVRSRSPKFRMEAARQHGLALLRRLRDRHRTVRTARATKPLPAKPAEQSAH